MKNFKLADMYLQALLIIVFTAISISRLDYTFLVGYCAVGGWQLISMIIHESFRWFTAKGSDRRFYHNLSYIVVVLMASAPLLYITYFLFFPMIFLAPVMAVYYLRLCYKETYVYMKRPLSVLK